MSTKKPISLPTVKGSVEKPKRSRVSQTDIPGSSLSDALRVPKAILENYAGKPTEPFKVAVAMNVTPQSGWFRIYTGSAIAYGLTDGASNSDQITVLPLARRILEPTSNSDRIQAMREALLKTRVIREFLTHYNGSPLPTKDSIGYSVLKDLGVPDDRLGRIYNWIIESATELGLIQELKGKKYVYIDNSVPEEASISIEDEELEDPATGIAEIVDPVHPIAPPAVTPSIQNSQSKRVFISHGKNKDFLDLIKQLLQFGELEPVVSIEHTSVSDPIPVKVMKEMRACGAAIIHVDSERKLIDPSGLEHVILNENVLIEIGAAMALYGRRFILIVKEGITLPSNLQGLYEVRYTGDKLDGDTTIRLLKAINEMKNIVNSFD